MMPKRVALIAADWPIYEQYCPNFTGMMDGLKRLGIEHRLITCRPTLSVDAVIDYQPDLVVYCLLDMVKARKWRMRIREALPNAKIIMWYGDYRDAGTGQIPADMSEIDMMFVSNNNQKEFYEKLWRVKRCEFMPLGSFLPELVHDDKYAFDFVFIGGKITGQRFMDRVKQIQRFEKEQGLKVLDASAQGQPVLRAKIMKMAPTVYYSSRVVLDLSHFTEVPGYTSNRFWIIGASGGAALTKRFPGCEEFYPEDSRAYYDTYEEAIALKEKLLTDEGYRSRIKKRAREVAERHTYDHRFREIFKLLYQK